MEKKEIERSRKKTLKKVKTVMKKKEKDGDGDGDGNSAEHGNPKSGSDSLRSGSV